MGQNIDNVTIPVPSTSAPCSIIKTLVFFDLETTGLPELEFFKTKITELSFAACSVEHLMETQQNDIPRVLHKLTLCFNPYKRIDLKAMDITGLNNELLEHEKKFDENTMRLLECFINQLQQPVCLIAHNGSRFDFPLFKKQYDILNGAFSDATKCCDSLKIFRKIDKLTKSRQEMLAKNYSLQKWDDIKDSNFAVNLEIEHILEHIGYGKKPGDEGIDQIFKTLVERELNNITKKEESDKKIVIDSELAVTLEIEQLLEHIRHGEHSEEGIDEIFKTLVKRELDIITKREEDNMVKTMQKINETTPVNSTKSANLRATHVEATGESRKRPNNMRRELFPSTSKQVTSKTRQSLKGKFTLKEIYKRCFNSDPTASHDAASDVISLLKCAVAHNKDFVELVMEHSVDFKDVKKN